VGVDIRPDAKSVEQGRISIEIGDCGDPGFLIHLSHKYRPSIIVDDASHRWSHQMTAFEFLWTSLEPGGVFIMEDLGTSFPPAAEKSYSDSPIRASDYFLNYASTTLSGGKRHAHISPFPLSPMQAVISKEIAAVASIEGSMIFIKRRVSNRMPVTAKATLPTPIESSGS